MSGAMGLCLHVVYFSGQVILVLNLFSRTSCHDTVYPGKLSIFLIRKKENNYSMSGHSCDGHFKCSFGRLFAPSQQQSDISLGH